jgi:hypothetical protein
VNITLAVEVCDDDHAFFVMVIVKKPPVGREVRTTIHFVVSGGKVPLFVFLPRRFADNQTSDSKQGTHDTLA